MFAQTKAEKLKCFCSEHFIETMHSGCLGDVHDPPTLQKSQEEEGEHSPGHSTGDNCLENMLSSNNLDRKGDLWDIN